MKLFTHTIIMAARTPRFFVYVTFLLFSGFSTSLLAEYSIEKFKISVTPPIMLGFSSALQDSVPLTRKLAADALGRIGKAAKQHTSAVAILLKDKDPEVRAAAVTALGRMGITTEEHSSALATLLEDNDPTIRIATANALGQMGSVTKEQIPKLVVMLKDDDTKIRQAAAEALGKIGAATMDKEQAAGLFEMLKAQKLPRYRQNIADALGGMGEAAKDQAPALGDMLKDQDADVRRAAASILGGIGAAAKEQAPALAALLSDKEWNVRVTAANALGKMGVAAKEQAPELVAALKDEMSNVRWRAANALGQMGETAKQHIPALNDLLTDQDSRVSDAAARAITQTESATGAKALAALALSQNQEAHVRYNAIIALGQMGSVAEEHAPVLVELLKDQEGSVRRSAAIALGQMGILAKEQTPALAVLLKDQDYKVRMAVTDALGKMGTAAKELAPALAVTLKDQERYVRRGAAEALGSMGATAKEQAPALVALLKDEYWEVRVAAAGAIGRMGAAAKEQGSALVALLNDEISNVRAVAAEALGRMGVAAKEQAHVLAASLKHQRNHVIETGVWALGQMGVAAKEQAPAIAALLQNRDPEVRQVIWETLIESGPHEIPIVTHILNSAYYEPHETGLFRLMAHLVGGGNQDVEGLIALVGKPARHTVETQLKSVCNTNANATATINLLNTALSATIESSPKLQDIQNDISEQIAIILKNCSGYFAYNDSLLINVKSNFLAIDSPHIATVNYILESGQKHKLFNYLSTVWLGHAFFWMLLLTAYPTSRNVQAIFFWNPWVRRIGGLGYVGLALIWIPFLRNRLFAPFRDLLIKEVTPSDMSTETYYAGTHVTNKATKQRDIITNLIPSIQGQIVLEGESGLGKTIFLQRLVQRSKRLTIYLNAAQCKAGVLDAIQNRLHGIAGDKNFLQTLIYSGAFDICVDGLNEVSPDTRAAITLFIEKYRGNIIIGTQPLEWTSPSSSNIFVIEPLEKNQIQEFLLSRRADLEQELSSTNLDYEKNVTEYLKEVFEKSKDTETIEAVQRILSNPMDLSVVAHMIYLGQQPNVYGLQAQHYQSMAEDFKSRNNERDFPLQKFSESVFNMRLEDEWRIPSDALIPELECMVRHKMVLTRQYAQSDGNTKTVWQFRHDKIMDYFIVQMFLGANNDNPLKYIKDPRFRGVYFFLASLIPLKDANILREQIILYAADTKDHSVSDSFIKILHERQVKTEAHHSPAL